MNGPRWRPSAGFLVVAAVITAAGLGYLWESAGGDEARDGGGREGTAPVTVASASSAPPHAAGPAVVARAASVAPPPVAPGAAAAPARQIPRMRDPNGDQSPDLSDYVNPGEVPTMAEVIDRLHRAGVHTGLGAFQPPGTRPPLVGLAVPEDFPLPDGYVRHYQATDDGQRIEPILMFAPDRQFYDAAGHPIAIPKDRVVPPELAPPGMPIRRITVPAPIEPGRPGN